MSGFITNLPQTSTKFVLNNIERRQRRRNPTDIYLPKFGDRNIRRRFEICSELTKKTSQRIQWLRFAAFIVNL